MLHPLKIKKIFLGINFASEFLFLIKFSVGQSSHGKLGQLMAR
jgi:hypothetical protein